MSFSFCNLASGSKGNATVVASGEEAFLIDAGLSCREILSRLEQVGLAAYRLKGLVLTHEHNDHVRGVAVLGRRLRLPIFCTAGTAQGLKDTQGLKLEILAAGDILGLAGCRVQPFSLPHDAADPVGVVVERSGVRLGVATDLGQATKLVRTRLEGCRALLLESNHDPQMLHEGPYPVWLKQRVRGQRGHLSNQQGAELLGQLAHDGLATVLLGHLSEVNNRPELALAEARQALSQAACPAGLHAGQQHCPSAWFSLD